MSKNSEKVEIMEIPFVNNTKDNFLHKQVKPYFTSNEKCFIVTANPEIVMETRKNKAYKNIVQSAEFVVPDGIGIITGSKI